jgi:hypothetical protein
MTIFKPVVRLTFFALLGAASVWAGDWPLYRHDALGTSNANETLTAADRLRHRRKRVPARNQRCDRS